MKLQFTEMGIQGETSEGREGQVSESETVKSEMPTGHPNAGGQAGSWTCKSGVQGRGLSRDRYVGATSKEMVFTAINRLFLEVRVDRKTQSCIPGLSANKRSLRGSL